MRRARAIASAASNASAKLKSTSTASGRRVEVRRIDEIVRAVAGHLVDALSGMCRTRLDDRRDDIEARIFESEPQHRMAHAPGGAVDGDRHDWIHSKLRKRWR